MTSTQVLLYAPAGLPTSATKVCSPFTYSTSAVGHSPPGSSGERRSKPYPPSLSVSAGESASPAHSVLHDEELAGIPLEFVRDSLVRLAPRLVAGADSTWPVLPPLASASASGNVLFSADSLPTVQDCLFDPPPSLPRGYALPPTHLLAVTTPAPSPPRSTPVGLANGHSAQLRRVLVPIHSLAWAVVSPVLAARLSAAAPCPPSSPAPSSRASPSSPSSSGEPARLTLAVLPLALPSLAGFAALHSFIYTGALGVTDDYDDDGDDNAQYARQPVSSDESARRARTRARGVLACAAALGVQGAIARNLHAAVQTRWGDCGDLDDDDESREEDAEDSKVEEDGEEDCH